MSALAATGTEGAAHELDAMARLRVKRASASALALTGLAGNEGGFESSPRALITSGSVAALGPLHGFESSPRALVTSGSESRGHLTNQSSGVHTTPSSAGSELRGNAPIGPGGFRFIGSNEVRPRTTVGFRSVLLLGGHF